MFCTQRFNYKGFVILLWFVCTLQLRNALLKSFDIRTDISSEKLLVSSSWSKNNSIFFRQNWIGIFFGVSLSTTVHILYFFSPFSEVQQTQTFAYQYLNCNYIATHFFGFEVIVGHFLEERREIYDLSSRGQIRNPTVSKSVRQYSPRGKKIFQTF